ncbi:class I SAM-dependent methyltransferase [Methylobacterium brachythecii]|uniref:S-adenosyl-L-methionine-dependent methyltransferase Phc n=1 Tax=Methylobacterium brachythecii TaxID=1176177 RepID=A0A7W6F4Y3_9HYPH|nr:class I SAM-dependent methyltransferase [Methylobacterium brachythecii]MBB3900860.1 ubiquinone/menaquinone biosynthesis C-methylase UbiE [Methylobacterium brachythecii]GLS47089.1 S-adenosyl-L-methionine-dependent methyltransferase Phc [Methylobacterium brachythecii]
MAGHEANVTGQFEARAADYVTSAAHAAGDDLAQLADLARASPDAAALDLGCGGGHATYAIAPHVRSVTAFDLSPAMLSAVSEEAGRRGLSNIRTEQGTVQALPFRDESFDLVVSRFSAHHWTDLVAALTEARRVLSPRGRLVMIDTAAPENPLLDTHLQSWELLRDPSHGHNYAPSQWRAMLARAGFVPGRETLRRLRLDFASWIARMGTPEADTAAIRRLQQRAPESVRTYFALEDDGTFTLDTLTIEADPDGASG